MHGRERKKNGKRERVWVFVDRREGKGERDTAIKGERGKVIGEGKGTKDKGIEKCDRDKVSK